MSAKFPMPDSPPTPNQLLLWLDDVAGLASGLAGRVRGAAAPGGPVSSFVEVNETGILMAGSHSTSEWWLTYRDRAARAGRVEVLIASIGDLVRVACEDRTEAEWLVGHMVGRGVPAACVRANRSIPKKIRTKSGRR